MSIHSLVLTEEQSAFLLERGKHFVVLTPGSYPISQGRVVLHLVGVGDKEADEACSVALGQARAVKIRTRVTSGDREGMDSAGN